MHVKAGNACAGTRRVLYKIDVFDVRLVARVRRPETNACLPWLFPRESVWLQLRDHDAGGGQRGLASLWTMLEDQFRAALKIQPFIISNGSESGWLMPAHLATMGFYVLRVRSNLVEIRLVLDR
jgi:hypothetical protein